jgi:hypothetical protein
MAFLTQNKAELCKNLIITLVLEKNANFFAENCQKLQKIVIITSVPGHPAGLQGKRGTRTFLYVRSYNAESILLGAYCSSDDARMYVNMYECFRYTCSTPLREQ